jgi:antitoxin VapB
MNEFERKQNRIQQLLSEHNLDALLLLRTSSVAWATCGARTHINLASTTGAGSLLVTRSNRFLITSNLEAARLEQEEGLAAQGWEFCVKPWYEPQDQNAHLTRGLRLGADNAFAGATDLSREIAWMRVQLTPEEGKRFRDLGYRCAQAIEATAWSLQPGQSEIEIAARQSYECERRGVQAVVNIVATDWRIASYRHALPTEKKLERYAMLVLCGRRHGLVCSTTRFVHFGRLSTELRRKAEATAKIAVAFFVATRPNTSLGEIFKIGIRAYAAEGHFDEWHNHHQGGPTGYEAREIFATADSPEIVTVGQAYTWNPSIGDMRSVDTFIVGETENEIITDNPSWHSITIETKGGIFHRSAILEVL